MNMFNKTSTIIISIVGVLGVITFINIILEQYNKENNIGAMFIAIVSLILSLLYIFVPWIIYNNRNKN